MSTTARLLRSAIAALAVTVAGSCVVAAPVPAPGPAPAPSDLTVTYDGAGPAAARIGLIGDSTLASIRWTAAYAPLRQWNYTFDAESCRRTITVSCHGPDGYTPANALDTARRLNGQLGSVLVMMTGANDPVNRFGEGVDAMVAEARAQGVTSVVWLTVHGAAATNDILAQRVQQYGGYLVLADWAGYSAPHPEWTNADGLHITTAGAAVLAQFIADHVARILPPAS
ncbi:MAG: hypothetical protein ABW219_04830 [Ilumatobacteraceae bacterium]